MRYRMLSTPKDHKLPKDTHAKWYLSDESAARTEQRSLSPPALAVLRKGMLAAAMMCAALRLCPFSLIKSPPDFIGSARLAQPSTPAAISFAPPKDDFARQDPASSAFVGRAQRARQTRQQLPLLPRSGSMERSWQELVRDEGLVRPPLSEISVLRSASPASPTSPVSQMELPQWRRGAQVPGISSRVSLTRGAQPASSQLLDASMERVPEGGAGGKGMVAYEQIGRVNQVLCSRRHFAPTDNIRQL
jgi:hypothetical protein